MKHKNTKEVTFSLGTDELIWHKAYSVLDPPKRAKSKAYLLSSVCCEFLFELLSYLCDFHLDTTSGNNEV